MKRNAGILLAVGASLAVNAAFIGLLGASSGVWRDIFHGGGSLPHLVTVDLSHQGSGQAGVPMAASEASEGRDAGRRPDMVPGKAPDGAMGGDDLSMETSAAKTGADAGANIVTAPPESSAPPPVEPSPIDDKNTDLKNGAGNEDPAVPGDIRADTGGKSGVENGPPPAGSGSGRSGVGQGFDTPPRVVRQVRPTYPRAAERRGITGRVRLECLVDERGKLVSVTVLEAEPQGVFEKSAASAVRKWVFTAALRNGRPVPAKVTVPVVFSME